MDIFTSPEEMATRLAIAEAKLSAYQAKERLEKKCAEFRREVQRSREFLQANGFIVISKSAGEYSFQDCRDRMDPLTVDQRLDLDLRVIGNAYFRIVNGVKERIDPLTLVHLTKTL